MKLIQVVFLLCLTSCAGMMPDIAKIVDDMTDTAVRVDLAKEITELKDTDVHVRVDIISKDPIALAK